ncbi:MAG: hypothetical protein L3J82_05385 [Planctomycetes bacterium]|nr:hypothetical protein [Planctomycetota bacterium]
MWDRSYQWQRRARVLAGGLAIGALLTGAVMVNNTDAAERAKNGLSEIERELSPDSDSLIVADFPADKIPDKGTLVFREGPTGESIVVGRVTEVSKGGLCKILLTPAAAGLAANGAVIKVAQPAHSIEEAIRLLVAPGIPRDEAKRARDELWPAIEEHVIPALKDNLTRELTSSFDDMDSNDIEILDGTVADLRKEMEDLEQELINRIANRAWEVIGVSGVAEGVLRKAGDSAGNTYGDAKDWVKSWWGDDSKTSKSSSDFLSKEKATALRIALEEEVTSFLEENDAEIKKIFNKVLNERRSDFINQFEIKWGPKLYNNAIVPAWEKGEPGVLVAVDEYLNDFAQRRLLTKDGGPRLQLAYALRTALDITDHKLLVLEPNNSGQIKVQGLRPDFD